MKSVTTRTRWWLRTPQTNAEIGEEPLVIGRGATCHISFPEDALASRVHAKVWHEGSSVVLEDLGSTNGTFVDEHRIAGRRTLGSGTRIRIGSQLLWLYAGESPPRGPRHSATRGDLPAHRSRPQQEGESQPGPTDATSVFAMVAPMVDSALAAGQTGEALRILEPYLDAVLAEARRGEQGDPEVLRLAFSYAVKLAKRTGHGAWIDYLVELTELSGTRPPPDVLSQLPQVASEVDSTERNWRALSAP